MRKKKAPVHSSTAEDYLKAILEVLQAGNTDLAPMGLVAETLSLTPGTVTTMVQRLTTDGLTVYEPRKGCTLTEKGRGIALRTLRRHRVLETFLVESLGMDWSVVHEEAQCMEHGVSDTVINRLWDFLGRPLRDPHGGLIPDKDLRFSESEGEVPLNTLMRECEAVLIRIPDRSPELLRALEKAGISPGKRLRLERIEGTGTVAVSGVYGMVSLSLEIASNIWVRPIPKQP